MTGPVATRLARYLAAHPEDSNLSMSELARALGCSRQYVRQILPRSQRRPDTGATSRAVRAGESKVAPTRARRRHDPRTNRSRCRSAPTHRRQTLEIVGAAAEAAPRCRRAKRRIEATNVGRSATKKSPPNGDGETPSAHAKSAARCNSAGGIACCASSDVWRAARHFHGRTPTSSAGEPAERDPSAQLRAGCASTVKSLELSVRNGASMAAGPEPTTVRERLDAFLKANPNAWYELTVPEIAAELGCTRQALHKVLPEGFRDGRDARRLARFVEQHPQALLTPSAGGMSLSEIARETRIGQAALTRLWRSIPLPPRTTPRTDEQRELRRARHRRACEDWRGRNPERARAIQLAAHRRWKARVLRRETCVVCGKVFDWTNRRESNRKQKRGLIVCSPVCGRSRTAIQMRAAASKTPRAPGRLPRSEPPATPHRQGPIP